MSIVYLVLNTCSDFEAGTLLRHDNGKLIDLDKTDMSFDFNDQIIKDWKQLEENSILRMTEMSKSERLSTNLNIFNGDSPLETLNDEGLIQSPMNIFLRQDSVLNFSIFNDKDNKFHLVKIRWKKDIYGYWTKSYMDKSTKYVAVTLLPAFIEIVSKDNPECQFENRYFEENKCGVIVDEDYVEQVEENLIFLNKGSIIDMRCTFKPENCSCNKIAKGEYVKFVNGKTKEIGTVKSCHQINGHHCLKVQLCNKISGESEEDECYIRSEDVIKQGLKQMTKYYEGVLIDPSSIYKMEAKECETRKVGDQVMVVHRDSGQVYDYSIVWLGQVNGVDVAALQSISEIINPALENLMFAGKFQGAEYFNTKSLLVPLSLTMKISLEVKITPTRIKDIVESLKHNSVTNDVHTQLKFIHDHIYHIIALPDDYCTSILKLCSFILKHLKRDVISQKLKSADKATVNTIENNQKLLLDCSLVALNIICDICLMSADLVTKVSERQTLVELLDNIFNETYDCYEKITNMEQIFTNVMMAWWQIIITCNIKPDNCLSKMTYLFKESRIKPNIKLSAALCISFIINTTSDCVEPIVKYLKDSYKQPVSTAVQIFNKNDILIGLGKIFKTCELQILPEKKSHQSSFYDSLPNKFNQSSDKNISCATAESGKADGILSADDYEECIDKLLDDISDDSQDFLVTEFDKMKNRGLLMKLITKPEFVNLKYSADLLFNNRHNDEVLATMVNKCDPDPSQCKTLINLAGSLLIEGSSTNIVVIIDKVLAHSKEDWDQELLSLAYTALLKDKLDIFPLIISKCKDINSYMNNNETFVTFIMKQSFTEEKIIEAIKLDNFDINKPNKDGKSPIVLAYLKKLSIVFQYLCGEGAVIPPDLFSHNQ